MLSPSSILNQFAIVSHNTIPNSKLKICSLAVRISPSIHHKHDMAVDLRSHAFAGNPLMSHNHRSALESLTSALSANSNEKTESKVLPFRKGRPLARSSESQGDSPPLWSLGWLLPSDFEAFFSSDSFVYLGSLPEEDLSRDYWAIDVSGATDLEVESEGVCAFVELRTLMVATDWVDRTTMNQLAIAGHAKALIEWHSTSRFCGYCGASTKPIDAGRRKQCTVESCKKRIYPRVDPVVIMLVIDKANDRVLLSRQSRFVPRMWSCLAGFMEPGESLEEAVRRETLEETGIEIDEVVYHSSQPWPVGPSSMPCQLMVGFFAYAKSLEIRVDKMELEDAQWHCREDVKRALTFTEYEKAQRTSALKVNQMCKGVGGSQSRSSDSSVESEQLAPMFIPGPFAIAHHLISSWVNDDADFTSKPSSSMSNL